MRSFSKRAWEGATTEIEGKTEGQWIRCLLEREMLKKRKWIAMATAAIGLQRWELRFNFLFWFHCCITSICFWSGVVVTVGMSACFECIWEEMGRKKPRGQVTEKFFSEMIIVHINNPSNN